MCGIVGVLRRTQLDGRDCERVEKAARALTHRGPDAAGEYRDDDGQLLMAMRRLSIIDIEGGNQPLFNEDRSIALIANGEIYNFVELRTRLSKKHHFRTASDCEVIVHAYEEYGLSFVDELRGMFAFALWDANEKRLVLARDRLGEKPLYLRLEPDSVVFASELKALLSAGFSPLELDPMALHRYLHFGWVPEPQTIVSGVEKLPPGHLLVIDARTLEVAKRRYWRLEDAPPVEGDPVSLIRSELDVIAEQTLRADVPVGVALSAGIDSSLLAALAARHSTKPLHAFTVGYRGKPPQDERDAAKSLAIRLGLDFHEIELDLPSLVEEFPLLPARADEPIADIAAFGYHQLSRAAREQGCPVLLQGQGGDELFWGYQWAIDGALATERLRGGRRPRRWPQLLHELASGPNRRRAVVLARALGGVVEGWSRAPLGSADDFVLYQLTEGYQMAAFMARDTYTASFAARVAGSAQALDIAPERDVSDVAVQVMGVVCRGYLLENGLAQGDRLSMSNSVELRLPLCDYRLAELAVGLVKASRGRPHSNKQWLRSVAAEFLPKEVVERPKRGFNPPVANWVRALFHRYGPELEAGYLVEHKVLNPQAAARLWRPKWRFSPEHELGFRYLQLEYWARAMADSFQEPVL